MSNLHYQAEMIYMLALKAIANDDSLKCECGLLPYVDGEECPKCVAALALYKVEELRGKTVRRRKSSRRSGQVRALIASQKANQNDRRVRFEHAIS